MKQTYIPRNEAYVCFFSMDEIRVSGRFVDINFQEKKRFFGQETKKNVIRRFVLGSPAFPNIFNPRRSLRKAPSTGGDVEQNGKASPSQVKVDMPDSKAKR